MSVSTVVGLITVIGFIAVPAQSASAANYCPSGQYVQKQYSWAGTVVAQLCAGSSLTAKATLQSTGRFRGVKKHMALTICKWNGASTSDCASDSGNFYDYAGPVRERGGCQRFHSVMGDGAGTTIVNAYWILCD